MHIPFTFEQEQEINNLAKAWGYESPVNLFTKALEALQEKLLMEAVEEGRTAIEEGRFKQSEDCFDSIKGRLKQKYSQ